jgi:thiol-disulfide isomerase/thioredoxin
MKIILSSVFCLLTLLPSISSAEIYKCYVNGKLVFTDSPCEGDKVILGVTNSMAAEETPFVYEPLKVAYASNQWYYGHAGYKRALRLQKKYDAPIFVYFQADWCSYCRKLENQLIQTSKGVKALNKAIKVKVSPEDSQVDDSFFRKLGGTGYPTLFMQFKGKTNLQEIPTRPNNKMLSPSQLSQLIES